jgi:hypothetical protein
MDSKEKAGEAWALMKRHATNFDDLIDQAIKTRLCYPVGTLPCPCVVDVDGNLLKRSLPGLGANNAHPLEDLLKSLQEQKDTDLMRDLITEDRKAVIYCFQAPGDELRALWPSYVTEVRALFPATFGQPGGTILPRTRGGETHRSIAKTLH